MTVSSNIVVRTRSYREVEAELAHLSLGADTETALLGQLVGSELSLDSFALELACVTQELRPDEQQKVIEQADDVINTLIPNDQPELAQEIKRQWLESINHLI